MTDTTLGVDQDSSQPEDSTNIDDDRAELLTNQEQRDPRTEATQSSTKLWFTLLRVLSLFGSVYMIVVGSVNVAHCPINHKLPTWLIIMGAFYILANFMVGFISSDRIFEARRFTVPGILQVSDEEVAEERNRLKREAPIGGIIVIVVSAWIIVGSIWFFSCYHKMSHDPQSSDYCTPHIYQMIFEILIASYVMGILLVVLSCLVCGFACYVVLTADVEQIRRLQSTTA